MAVHALHNKEIRLIAHSNIRSQIKTYNEHTGRINALWRNEKFCLVITFIVITASENTE